MRKIKIAWKNRKKIIEGIWNNYFPNAYVERVAEKRLKICRSNMCGYYDKWGESEAAFIKGFEACASCGCKLSYATRSLSKECGISEKGLPPLWGSEMNEQEEDEFRNKVGLKNE